MDNDLNTLINALSMASDDDIAAMMSGIDSMNKQERIALEVLLRSRDADKATRDGYGNFYFCLFHRDIPDHAVGWVDAILEAFEDETGALIEGFRGSTKSTVTSSMVLYLNSLYPERSSLVVCATESDAKNMAQFIADTIEYNAGYKVAFPHIVPDKDRGWGADGYHIKDDRVDYAEWVQRVMADHGRDPSLLAVSVTSGAVGKHPTLALFLDDIHNMKNTRSQAERERVVATVKSDVLPTMSRAKPRPFVAFTFTPWHEEDVYAEMKRTGMFNHVSTPVYEVVEESDVYYDNQPIRLVWPEVFTLEEIKKWRKLLGPAEFARMYELNLERARNTLFKYYTYPHEMINPLWQKAGGVDYASINMPTRNVEGGRSHFAFGYVTKTSMNQLVVFDGIVRQQSQGESELDVHSAQERFSNWKFSVIESNGKGEEFINLIRRNPKTRYVAHSTGGRSKEARLYDMAPWFENMNVLVSDADTPFLNEFRRWLEEYPNIDKRDKRWDVADGVYHALFAFPECLTVPEKPTEMPKYEVKTKRESIWNSLGSR